MVVVTAAWPASRGRRGRLATAAITGAGWPAPLASRRPAQAGDAGGGRRSSGLPGNRTGHRIQPLFQHGDAGIQPVAVAVQRFDRGGQPLRLAVALPGDRLNLLRLAGRGRPPRPGRAAIRSPTDWRGSPDAPPRRPRQRPTIPIATACGGRIRPPPPESRTARRRYSRFRNRQPSDPLSGRSWPYEVVGPPEACRKSQRKH